MLLPYPFYSAFSSTSVCPPYPLHIPLRFLSLSLSLSHVYADSIVGLTMTPKCTLSHAYITFREWMLWMKRDVRAGRDNEHSIAKEPITERELDKAAPLMNIHGTKANHRGCIMKKLHVQKWMGKKGCRKKCVGCRMSPNGNTLFNRNRWVHFGNRNDVRRFPNWRNIRLSKWCIENWTYGTS